MRNRPIRHGGLVSEVGYSSSTCRIQQEYQVGVLGRTNGMMLVVSLPTKEMLHLEMNKNLLFFTRPVCQSPSSPQRVAAIPVQSYGIS